jgi:hypothetical protein
MRLFHPFRVTSLATSMLFLVAVAVQLMSPCCAVADDQDEQIQEAKRRKERYTNWMREFTKDTTVRVTMPGEDEAATAELTPTPVFRYSSEIIADDATLWLWTLKERPVALQKVEVNNYGGQWKWTICFGSVSQGLVTARWRGERTYAATAPGVTYRPIPRADAPSERAKARTAQMKTLKSRFSGLTGFDADAKGGVEMTPITTPLYEYADQESKLPLGAIYSMVNSKGALNPGFLLILEARPTGDRKWRWEYGSVRLGTGQVLLRLDDAEVWRQEPAKGMIFDNWTYYFLRRDFE